MHKVRAVYTASSFLTISLLLVASMLFLQSPNAVASGLESANVSSAQTYFSGVVSEPTFGPLYSNSVSISQGYQNYIYVATGGGDHPISTTSFNVSEHTNNGCSVNGSIIGYSRCNTANIETKDLDYSISGIGVNLPLTTYRTFSSDSAGSHYLNETFALSNSSLVLLASAGTNEGYPTIQGALGNVSTCTPWGDLGILFSYAILAPGTYNFSISYQLWGNSTDYASSVSAVLYEFNDSGKIYQYVSPSDFGPLYSDSVILPTGYLTYVYAATGGGDHQMRNPSFNASLSVNNHCSQNGSIIGYSHSNTGIVQTADYDYSISGIGVNLPIASIKTYENDSNGSHIISGQFTLNSYSLVLLASTGTNQGYPTIDGAIGNSSSCTPWGDLGVSFSYAMLHPGNYNFSISYKLWGNSTDYAASTAAVLYVFNVSSNVYQVKFTETGLPLNNYHWYITIGSANYTSYTNTIIASVLAGEYSFTFGSVHVTTSSVNISYGNSNRHGTLIVPSSKMNYTLVYDKTAIEGHGANSATMTFLLTLNSVFIYAAGAAIVVLVVSFLYLVKRRNRNL